MRRTRTLARSRRRWLRVVRQHWQTAPSDTGSASKAAEQH